MNEKFTIASVKTIIEISGSFALVLYTMQQ